jgi:hypothetical protein
MEGLLMNRHLFTVSTLNQLSRLGMFPNLSFLSHECRLMTEKKFIHQSANTRRLTVGVDKNSMGLHVVGIVLNVVVKISTGEKSVQPQP